MVGCHSKVGKKLGLRFFRFPLALYMKAVYEVAEMSPYETGSHRITSSTNLPSSAYRSSPTSKPITLSSDRSLRKVGSCKYSLISNKRVYCYNPRCDYS